MKMFHNSAAAVLMATTLTIFSANIFASGSHEHKHEAAVFDPVSTEFGSYEPGMKATRTIEIGMSDNMRFTPDLINVKAGEIVMFKHKNTGDLMHEFVLGTGDSLDQHAEMMKKFPGMEHDEPYMTHIAPGESGQIMWKFSESGEFTFGCLIPGHYDAGMKGRIIVNS
jgi:uncharacterized cupredoxin-like copper-binding protein